jgi:hypothetical protein
MTRSRFRFPAVACLIAAALAASPGNAEAETGEPINPDRPGAGTSAETLRRGLWQIETGLGYARESNAGERTRTFSGALTLRYGLVDGVEFRIDGQPFVVERGDERATGFGDTAVGAKIRLLEGEDGTIRPTLSVLPALKLPTAPEPIGTRRPDAALLGLASWDLGRADLDVNAGVTAIGQRGSDSYRLQALAVVAVQMEVTPTARVLADVFFRSPAERDGRHELGMTVGGLFLIAPAVALDAAVQTTLAGRGPEYVLQAGISLRL